MSTLLMENRAFYFFCPVIVEVVIEGETLPNFLVLNCVVTELQDFVLKFLLKNILISDQ